MRALEQIVAANARAAGREAAAAFEDGDHRLANKIVLNLENQTREDGVWEKFIEAYNQQRWDDHEQYGVFNG